MSAVLPRPETTLVILLGASKFPRVRMWPFNAAFRNSAQALKQYFLDSTGFGVPESNVLDLFDSTDEQPKQNDRIGDFIIKAFGQQPQPSDVVVYYVGHGFSEGSQYFLALHEMREDNANSSYPAKALARVLGEHARHARKYLILDCCYAARAAEAFVPQGSGHSEAIATQIASEFVDLPDKGTAVLCAADPRTTALAPVDDQFTMFSGGLLKVLGDSAHGDRPLTLEELNVYTYAAIKERFKDDAVRPNLHSPDQSKGDVAKVRLFPLWASRSNARKATGSTDSEFIDVFEADASPLAQTDRISCVVVAADAQATDEGLPLREHVRRAWDHYGQEIFEAVSRSASAKSGEHSAARPVSREPRLLYLSVDQLFRSEDRLASAVKAMCKAEVAVFDVTGFDARTVFMLGVRSVARRGITICSVGGEYAIGGELSVPFNLQMLNLAAHSGAQEKTKTDPLTLIGQKIKNGFLELGTLPHYLDLPAYDSVRRLGVESTAYKPVQYHDRVLALCPFSKPYTDSNWERYLRPELTGKLKKRLAANKVNADSLRLVRLLDLATPRLVAQTLFESIRLIDMCIVDWTGLRANVMYEAGVRLATNPLGAVHIIEQSDSAIPPEHKASTAEMIAFFKPIRYRCSAGGTEAYEKMISSFEASLERYRHDSIEMIYRTVGESIDRRAQSAAIPVVEELIQSANMLESDDQQSTGISPILYQDVNKELLSEAQAAAAERRLAAWLFIDRRNAGEAIAADPVLLDKFRLLGVQVLQWLRKNPDDKVVAGIKTRLREIREIASRQREREGHVRSPDEPVRALARAKTLVAEAQFAREDGDYEVAVDALKEAVAALDQTRWLADAQTGQPLTALQKEIARALANCLGMIGGNYRRLNRPDDALASFKQGRTYEEDERFGVNSSYSLVNAITLPIEDGPKTGADQADLLRNAVRALTRQTGGERRLDRWAWADLGECYLLLRDLPRAEEAYESFRKHGTADSLDSVLPVLIRIRDALTEKDPDTALVIKKGMDSLKRAFGRG